jgi:hypothetical protein
LRQPAPRRPRRGRTLDGRFDVEGLEEDALCLGFRAVRTLVVPRPGYAEADRDFTVIVVAPPLWPFDREAALVPIVAAPATSGIRTATAIRSASTPRGVTPERLPGLLYDNLRLKNRRLDHTVDAAAAAFVRAHLPNRPTDPRPLTHRRDDDVSSWRPIVDVQAGSWPRCCRGSPLPVFLRLAAPVGQQHRPGSPDSISAPRTRRSAPARPAGGRRRRARGRHAAERRGADVRGARRRSGVARALGDPTVADNFLEITAITADDGVGPNPTEGD